MHKAHRYIVERLSGYLGNLCHLACRIFDTQVTKPPGKHRLQLQFVGQRWCFGGGDDDHNFPSGR